ncbi:hypothetical protein, partial [Bradyrhizobium sp. CCBAU 11357]|uniref:hypothetical protein n=1 Tax=Bradyrhizobium sp. CCBAU 11357 TaxID=1630808 RepID=UPI0023046310
MQQVEKRELFEQERKSFEAGVQRADKRSGSFNFLTWSFFIAPLIACEEFLAATFKSALAEHEDATAAQAGAGPQRTNDELPASDPAKPGAEDERPKGPAASSETHVAQLDPASLPAEPQEHAPRPGTAGGEAVAVASYGSEGGGGEDAVSFKHQAHTSADASHVNCVNWPSADFNFVMTESSGGATLESIWPSVLYDSYSPSVVSSSPVLGDLGNEVVVGITPVEAAAPPALATASDSTPDGVVGAIALDKAAVPPTLATASVSVSTLPNGVVGAIAPVEAAQPTLTTWADAGTLPDHVVGTIGTVEAAVSPALAAMTDTVSTLRNNVAGAIAPLEATAQPTPTTLADTAGTLPDGMVGALAPVEAALPPALA